VLLTLQVVLCGIGATAAIYAYYALLREFDRREEIHAAEMRILGLAINGLQARLAVLEARQDKPPQQASPGPILEPGA